jgi:recombination protein RecT
MKKITQYVDSIRSRIIAVLPPEVVADRYLSALTEYLFRNQDIFNCDRCSIDNAIIDAALLGLELGPPLDLATIIPYKKDKSGPPHAGLVVEYRGHMIQVYRTGWIKSVEARPVYENDHFEFEFGRRPALCHRPTKEKNRGALVYAYAIAHLSAGGSAIEVINRHDADRARADSAGANKPGSLWQTRVAEMWTKTAIKKLVNRMPRTATAASSKAGGDLPPQYTDLINAVMTCPDIYKSALNDLQLETPSDMGSIDAVLGRMRSIYRSQYKNGSDDPPPKP